MTPSRSATGYKNKDIVIFMGESLEPSYQDQLSAHKIMNRPTTCSSQFFDARRSTTRNFGSVKSLLKTQTEVYLGAPI
jgi:hypothetical protein